MSLLNNMNENATSYSGISAQDELIRETVFAKIRQTECQWPIQIKLVPTAALYFDQADLLIAADCCAFVHPTFHADCMSGKTTIVGCPKLDGVDYSEKLSAIFAENDIKSVTVARMEVPCCSGIVSAAKNALSNAGKSIACNVVTISINGEVID